MFSENSNETNEITDLEEATEASVNKQVKRVTFDIPSANEEDVTHDDVDTGKNEDDQENNGTPVIDDNVLSEENNNDQ